MNTAKASGGKVLALRLLVISALFAGWEFLPQIPALRELSPLFNPFFISSPSRVVERLGNLLTGTEGYSVVWPFFWETTLGTLVGVVVSVLLGAALGLALSNSDLAYRVVSPLLAVINATPRVALIPLFIILAGTTLLTTVLTVAVVVTFIVFYNAYAGGASVQAEMVQNARLAGASSAEIMRRIRLPYVLVWTFTSLPNAISFGLISAVMAEILMGRIGMGRLLSDSLATVDSTLMFSVIVLLAIFGVVLVTLAQFAQRRVLHWWKP